MPFTFGKLLIKKLPTIRIPNDQINLSRILRPIYHNHLYILSFSRSRDLTITNIFTHLVFPVVNDGRSSTVSQILLVAAEAGGPVADAADGVEGQPLGAHVLPAEQRAVVDARARDELLARRRVREVADVQALDGIWKSDVRVCGVVHRFRCVC